ncbi:MAG: triose-phosphate isomerase [Planctomycetota bacterium]
MRTPFLAGNWKMHMDRASVAAFCEQLRGLDAAGARVGVFPSFVHLRQAVEALAGTGVIVGAQTCRPEPKGAFTGEVSVTQIKDAGATHVIVGHSERRHVMGESDADVRARLDAVLAAGLDVILCVGETLEERQAERTEVVVTAQLDAGLSGVPGDTVGSRVTLAYEPVWAIGTGLTATPEQAQEVHALLRARLAALAGRTAADATAIQYGGSVKPDNITELMACPDVDGALVGGASLDAASFFSIVRAGAGAPDRAGRPS